MKAFIDTKSQSSHTELYIIPIENKAMGYLGELVFHISIILMSEHLVVSFPVTTCSVLRKVRFREINIEKCIRLERKMDVAREGKNGNTEMEL